MSSLTLATLDNDAVENHTDTQINKLFPKCRPRSDINLNPIIHHPQHHQQQQIERTTAIDNTPSIPLINTDRSSDRIIEIAGGREIYSQNRIKAARKSRGSTFAATVSIAAANGSSFDTAVTNNIDLDQTYESSSITKVVANSHPRVYNKSPVRHNGNVWELRTKEIVGPKISTASSLPQTRGKRRLPAPAAGLTETVFSAEVVMTRELAADNTDLDNDQSAVAAQVKTFPGEDLSPENAVVVFDDIDENNGCWYHHRHGHDENIVDVLMDNEQEEQQHQRRMYHYRRPQNNGLDLRIDLTEMVDVASSQSTPQQTIYQTDNMLLDVQREETRIGAQKVIGNLPIAVYEGSPRRYGSYRQSTYNEPGALKRDVSPVDGSGTSLGRHSSNSNSSTGSSISSGAVVKRDRLDESHCGNSGGYGLGSNMAYMPRPGFPQRVIYSSTGSNGGIIRSNDSVRSSTQYVDKLSQSNIIHDDCSPSSPIMPEPIDSTTSAASIPATTFDYLYEFSETRKVLEEFFKCPGPPDITTTISTEDINDHLDMDFKLDTDTDGVALGQYATKCGRATTPTGGTIDTNNLDNEDGVCTEDDDLGTVGTLNFEFQELEYELRRQARTSGSAMVGMYDTAATESSGSGEVSGNAYVGQRLAKVRMEIGDGAEFCDTSPSPIKHQIPHEQETTEHENNFLDLSVGTGSSGDLGETEVGLQVGHSRNFTLSPETTDCDSNCGDLDSEVSLMLMDNDLGPTSDFLGSSGDLVLPGDSLRIYSSMPVLEDGLSSGHASDTDNNNPTVRLMKKQITEIERELSTQTVGGGANGKHGHQQENGLMTCTGSLIGIRSGLSPKNENNSPMNGCSSNSYESNHLSGMDSSDKTPPPPAPVPHRCDSGISSGEVDSHNATNLMVLPANGAHVSGSNLSSKSNCSSSSLSGNNGSNGNNSNIVVLLDNPCHITTNGGGGGGGGGGNSSNSHSIVEAAIKDIRLTLQRTKTLPLKCHNGTGLPMNGQQGEDAHVLEDCPSPNGNIGPGGRLVDRLGVGSAAPIGALSTNDCERDETTTNDVRDGMNVASPVWVPRQREIATPNIAGDSDHKVPSSEEGGDEEEADTDLETDRLLGQQRTDDQGFYDDKDKESKKKSRNKEGYLDHAVLIEGVLFRARYLGSTQLVCEGQPTKTTRMMQAEEAVSRIKAPDGETQPSTEVDLFISTEKIMVLNTDLKEIMMDHALRTISYIADIGDLVVLMARRRFVPHELEEAPKINRTPKMICHVFESEEAQFIAQSIGQAFQVAYMEFLKANGIEDHSFVKEMDYQEVLNSQEIFGDELQMFAKKEMQKEVVVPKAKGEILGVVIVESGWGSMLPTVVIANLAPAGAAARCGQLNIGDQIIAINGVSLVGLPLSTCQTYIKNSKNQTVVKLTVVPCAPVVEVKIKRPDTKYQLGFSVQNGVICSLLRGGIAERGGVRVGHRIIEINNQSVVAVPHEKIVNLLATSVGEILMKTMPTSMFRLLTGQENPVYI